MIVDDEINRIEAELGTKVSPQQRQAIRQRIEVDQGFADIDVWGPEVKKPFIGAIGEGNRGGVIRKNPADLQNVVAVNPNLEPSEVRRNAVFPVAQAKADAAERRGVRVIPKPINRDAIAEQLALRERVRAEEASGQPLINRRGDIRRGQADDSALNIDNSSSTIESRLADAAQGPIAAEARRRQPLKPVDLIRLERKDQARFRGDAEPRPFTMPAIARAQEPGILLPGVGNDPAFGAPQLQGRTMRPRFGSDQRATSQVDSGIPNTASAAELVDIPTRSSNPPARPDFEINWEATVPNNSDPAPGQSPGVDDGIRSESRKRKQAPKTPSVNPAANQQRRKQESNGIFNRVGQHIKKRRGIYGVGTAAAVGVGAGLLISGERDRRREEEMV